MTIFKARYIDGTYSLIASELTRVWPTSGYTVARKGHETIITHDDPNIDARISDMFEEYRRLALQHTALVGIWTNPETNDVYFDLVDVIDDYNQALRKARDNHQISFWDNYNAKAIESDKPFIFEYKGHKGISYASLETAVHIAKGSYAKATQTLVEN